MILLPFQKRLGDLQQPLPLLLALDSIPNARADTAKGRCCAAKADGRRH